MQYYIQIYNTHTYIYIYKNYEMKLAKYNGSNHNAERSTMKLKWGP